MAQFLRPDSNVTQTDFTNGFAEIDESSASDADFAYGTNNTSAVLEVGLSNPSATPAAGTTTVRYRIAKTNSGSVDGGGNSVDVTCQVYQGTTLIASDTARTATGTWTGYSFNPDMSGVTDWTDLRLRFTTTTSGGSPANRRGGAVSWAELEAPDGSTTQDLAPPLLTSSPSFPAPTVAAGPVTLTPSLLTDADTLYTPTVAPGAVSIAPSLLTSAPSLHAPVVGSGEAALAPPLLSLEQTFHAATVAAGAVSIAPPVLSAAPSLFAPTVDTASILTPSLLTAPPSFHAPSVAASYELYQGIARVGAITASLTDNDGDGDIVVSLSGLDIRQDDVLVIAFNGGSLLGDDDISASGNNTGACSELADLYANDARDCNLWVGLAVQDAGSVDTSITIAGMASVSSGAVTIINYRGFSGSLHGSVVTATGTDSSIVNPPAKAGTNEETMMVVVYACAFAGGAWDTPPADVDDFVQATNPGNDRRVGIGEKRWPDSSSFDPAALTPSTTSTQDSWASAVFALKQDGPFTNEQTFFSPTVTFPQVLEPPLLSEGQSFPAPTVTPGTATVEPSLLTEAQSFPAPTVTPGTATLLPSLLTEVQTFHSATVDFSTIISPPLFSSPPSFHAPTVAAGTVTLEPPLLDSSAQIHEPTVTTSYDLLAPLLTEGETFYGPTVAQDQMLAPPLLYATTDPSAAGSGSGVIVTVTRL